MGAPTCLSGPHCLGALGWAGTKLRAWAELLRRRLALSEREGVPTVPAAALQLEPQGGPEPQPLVMATARPASGTA